MILQLTDEQAQVVRTYLGAIQFNFHRDPGVNIGTSKVCNVWPSELETLGNVVEQMETADDWSTFDERLTGILREFRDTLRQTGQYGLITGLVAEPIIKTCSDETIGYIVELLQSEQYRRRFKRDY